MATILVQMETAQKTGVLVLANRGMHEIPSQVNISVNQGENTVTVVILKLRALGPWQS